MLSLLDARNQHHRVDASLLTVNKSEVKRYLGYYRCEPDDRVDDIIDQCIKEELAAAAPQGLYSVFPIKRTCQETVLDLGFADVNSKDLSKNLSGCDYCILMAATIGPRIDQLIFKGSRLEPVKGFVLQSTGAMLIESYCDLLNSHLRAEAESLGYKLRPRFSPGYGDFSLEHQKDIFSHFTSARKIGLTLMDSGIMAPSKSVTAVIGMYPAMEKVSPDYLPECNACTKCGLRE